MDTRLLDVLSDQGQSIWLDAINRRMLDTGLLRRWIYKGVRGLTSNPTIFDKAIRMTRDYDMIIEFLVSEGKSPFEIYDTITVKDIQDASDEFYQVYTQEQRKDGYVSLEIDPELAFDTGRTVQEGLRIFRNVNRPNLMVKIPATEAAYPAVTELIGEGVNINVTLIFSLAQYLKALQAIARGIRFYHSKHHDSACPHAVTSVFVSRIDTAVDSLLDERLSQTSLPKARTEIIQLQGKAAVTNAQMIYQAYGEFLSSQDYKAMSSWGAMPPRIVWASTSTKSPVYSDIKYVQELMFPQTVNTVPEQTLESFLDHGIVRISGVTLDDNAYHLKMLERYGISLDAVCDQLSKEGILSFQKSFSSLLESIRKKSSDLVGDAFENV